MKDKFKTKNDYIKFLESLLDSECPCWREHNSVVEQEREIKRNTCEHKYIRHTFQYQGGGNTYERFECKKCGHTYAGKKVKTGVVWH